MVLFMIDLKKNFKKPQTLYDCTAVNNLIDKYYEKGGECVQLSEGGCGCGDWICYGEGLKTTIIKEIYLNCWSSAHSIRMYNKMPAKYAAILESMEV